MHFADQKSSCRPVDLCAGGTAYPRALDDREASFVVLMGVIYQPIIEAFAEVPAYLSIAAGVGLLETIRLLAR